jgi:hypothetical protein
MSNKTKETSDGTVRWERSKGGFLFRFEARLDGPKLVVMYVARKERNGHGVYSFLRPAAGYLGGKVYFRKHSFTRGLCSRLAHCGVRDISVVGEEKKVLDALVSEEARLNGETVDGRNERYAAAIERDQSVAFSTIKAMR